MEKDLNYIEKQILEYYTNHPEISHPDLYCKDCGKFLVYDNSDIHINERNNKNNVNELVCTGHTFLTKRIYNGNTYHLCRCKECVGKKFSQIYNVKFLYAAKFAKYTQYAFDVSNEDFDSFTHQRQSITKEKMISKYGDAEGIKRWESYCKKQSITNSFEYKQEKYGMSKEDFKKYNKSRACTKELFIKRYGEEKGLKKWDGYCERQRYTNSLEYFIKEYGIEKGIEKYNNFCDARIEAGKKISDLHQSTSKIADEFFSEIIKYFPNNKIWTHITNLGEKIINHKFSIDYYDETYNIAIEFFGDYWHMNPNKYDKNYSIPYITKSKYLHTANDIWENDKKRIIKISKILNTNIIIIWESEYRTNKKETIDKIVNMINKNKNIKQYES